jgi:hypothetical protein
VLETVAFSDERREVLEESKVGWRSECLKERYI